MIKLLKSKFINSFAAVTLCSILSISNLNIMNAKDNIKLDNKNIADKNKSWTISFNKPLDSNTINGKNISVTDITGSVIDTNLKLSEDMQTVIVAPKFSYSPGEYTLTLNDKIKSKDDTSLSNVIEMSFSITDFKLGNEMLIPKYSNLIDGKKIGLVTNQTGVNSKGKSTIDVLYNYNKAELKALYAPEHGVDGKAQAGKYVKSYIDEKLNIPVYSLYNDTRMPTEDMLSGVDVLVFDIQDIGARSYTYMSTLNYCMKAAAEYNKKIVVLDRPNPLGGVIFDGPILEDKFKSFVGIDNLPFTHGMTPGELAKYFNRNIDCDLSVVPMTGYTRDMVFQDTGLKWVQTSPYIPTVEAAFCYNVSGLGDGTGLFQDDYFTWVGGKGLNSDKFARILNIAGLKGVEFIPEDKGECGGVKINITDYHKFNPGKAGIYVLSYGKILLDFDVPKSDDYIILFDKIMGTDEIGKLLEENTPPEIIELTYDSNIGAFTKEREKYLIYK